MTICHWPSFTSGRSSGGGLVVAEAPVRVQEEVGLPQSVESLTTALTCQQLISLLAACLAVLGCCKSSQRA